MEIIEKKYLLDERNRKVAVQVDIETFEKIEEVLENYALVQLMKENEGDEHFSLNDAKAYYKRLKKVD